MQEVFVGADAVARFDNTTTAPTLVGYAPVMNNPNYGVLRPSGKTRPVVLVWPAVQRRRHAHWLATLLLLRSKTGVALGAEG